MLFGCETVNETEQSFENKTSVPNEQTELIETNTIETYVEVTSEPLPFTETNNENETNIQNDQTELVTSNSAETNSYDQSNSMQDTELSNWKSAYLALILEMKETYDISWFDCVLVDLDQDEIPELYLADTTNQIVGGFYTFDGTTVINVYQCSNRQSFYGYILNQSSVFTYTMWLGDETITEFKYSDTELKTIHQYSYLSETEEFYIDNLKCTEDEYFQVLNDLNGLMESTKMSSVDEIVEILEK